MADALPEIDPSPPNPPPPAAGGAEDTVAALSSGILDLLLPVVRELDVNVSSLQRAQNELAGEVERLTAELQVFHDATVALPQLRLAASKLSNHHKVLAAACSTMKSVRDRVDRLQAGLQRAAKAL